MVTPKLSLPFALQEIEIFSGCTLEMWALVRSGNGNLPEDKVPKFNIDLCDGQGNICMRMKGFSTRVLERAAGPLEASPAFVSGTSGAAAKIPAVLTEIAAKVLKVNSKNIDTDGELTGYGFDPVKFAEFANLLNQEFKLELTSAMFYEYPTIETVGCIFGGKAPGLAGETIAAGSGEIRGRLSFKFGR